MTPASQVMGRNIHLQDIILRQKLDKNCIISIFNQMEITGAWFGHMLYTNRKQKGLITQRCGVPTEVVSAGNYIPSLLDSDWL